MTLLEISFVAGEGHKIEVGSKLLVKLEFSKLDDGFAKETLIQLDLSPEVTENAFRQTPVTTISSSVLAVTTLV